MCVLFVPESTGRSLTSTSQTLSISSRALTSTRRTLSISGPVLSVVRLQPEIDKQRPVDLRAQPVDDRG